MRMHGKKRAGILGILLLGLLTAPYYLGIWNDRVALFTPETKGCYVTDTPVRSLPPADQAALRAGIPLETPEAAASALEDLCS